MSSDRGIDVGDLAAEAAAFDSRISERVAAGFVPDLRRAVKCEFFYKSFWRDPQFIRLYLGHIVDGYLDLLHRRCGAGLSILDVGCGAGYVSLELARNGHHVTAIDVSKANIDVARRMLAENPYRENFGSLRYEQLPFHLVDGQYDVVLFSMALHHMPDVTAVVRRSRDLTRPGGHFLCHEPCHERFREQDAAQVALIRAVLALTGHWYDPGEVTPHLAGDEGFATYVGGVQTEYVLERDPNEPQGQSPHDLEADGETMLNALRASFQEIEFRPGYSFIYRLLGGIRGPEERIRALADFLALYDRMAVERWNLAPNFFWFLGKRPA